MTVKVYESKDYAVWNAFISSAKNATFLFHRDFMEYHSDRFEDFSLMVYDGQKLIAVLPANKVGDEIFSHQGLSYGEIVVSKTIRIIDYLTACQSVFSFLKEGGINFITFKLLPKIYHKTFADEIDYMSFLTKADLIRSDAYLVIDKNQIYNPNRNRKRALKQAESLGIEIKEDNNYADFWNQILTPNLNNRFGVNPVHNLAEIQYLADKFPDQIKLFNAYNQGVLKAGVVMFLTDKVAHFQYSSGSEDRGDTAALDILFDYLIRKYISDKHVSFGSVCEDSGMVINKGLAYWKESFGAIAVTQNFIRISTDNSSSIQRIINSEL